MYRSALLTLFLAAGLSVSHPHQPTKREVSPTGTCGGDEGYTCPGSTPCCSQFGWCGTGSQYCAAGCQPNFGTCSGGGGGGGNPPPTNPPPGGGSSGGVRNIPRPKIGSVPYGRVITDCSNAGDIALTFDDGPSIYTNDLLDLLAQNNIKATFFVLGNSNGPIDVNAEWSGAISRAYSEGHQIGAHTWTHPDLTTLSSDGRREQMYLTEAALVNIIGVIPTYMRPPYLAFDGPSGADMADLGYHVISTNLDTRDWANQTPDTVGNSQAIFDDYISTDPASSNYIVLNHDIHQTTVQTLAGYEIRRLRERGYRPVTVGECLNDPASNWYRSP